MNKDEKIKELNQELAILKLQLATMNAHPIVPTAVQHIETFQANAGTQNFIQQCLDTMTEAHLDELKNSLHGNKDLTRVSALASKIFFQDMTNVEADQLAMKTVVQAINKCVQIAFTCEYHEDDQYQWKKYEKDLIGAMKRNSGRQGYNAGMQANQAPPANNRGLGI